MSSETLMAYGDCDPNANLFTEHIVCCSAQLRIDPDIAVKIRVIEVSEIGQDLLLHAVEHALVYKTVVADETNYAVPRLETVARPAEEAHVRVIELIFQSCSRISGVSVSDPLVYNFVRTVLVVVVLIQ